MTLSVLGSTLGTAKAGSNTHQIPYTGASSINAPEGTLSIIVITTTFDTSSSDSAISFCRVYWGGANYPELIKVKEYYDATSGGNVGIFYYNEPDNPSYKFENATLISWGTAGTCTDLMGAVIFLNCYIEPDVTATEATGNGSPSITWSTAEAIAIAVAGAVTDQADATKISCNDTNLYIEDVGSDSCLACYAVRTSSGSQTLDWTDTDNDEDWVATGASFKELVQDIEPSPISCVTRTAIGSVVADQGVNTQQVGNDGVYANNVGGIMRDSSGGLWATVFDTGALYLYKNVGSSPQLMLTVTEIAVFGSSQTWCTWACGIKSNDRIVIMGYNGSTVRWRIYNTLTETWDGSGFDIAVANPYTPGTWPAPMSMDIDSGDNPCIVFQGGNAGGYDTTYFSYFNGSTWSSLETVSTNDTIDNEGAVIHIRGSYSAGTITVLWTAGSVTAVRSRVAGSWGSVATWSSSAYNDNYGSREKIVYANSIEYAIPGANTSEQLVINNSVINTNYFDGRDGGFGSTVIGNTVYSFGKKKITPPQLLSAMRKTPASGWEYFDAVVEPIQSGFPNILLACTDYQYNVDNRSTTNIPILFLEEGTVRKAVFANIPVTLFNAPLEITPSSANIIAQARPWGILAVTQDAGFTPATLDDFERSNGEIGPPWTTYKEGIGGV